MKSRKLPQQNGTKRMKEWKNEKQMIREQYMINCAIFGNKSKNNDAT